MKNIDSQTVRFTARRGKVPLIVRNHHSAMCFMAVAEGWEVVGNANRAWQNKTARASAVSHTAAR